MVKRSSIGSMVRKRLSEITTSLQQKENHSTKDLVDHLVKENIALARLVQDRNKMIEMTGSELRKLRVGVQKVQLQNWNLAQSNSHMLGELHSNKEKVKALQHELVCKEAILKAKKHHVNDKETEVGESTASEDIKSIKSNKKSHGSQQVDEKGAEDNKRHCLKRQYVCSRMQQQEHAKKMFEFEHKPSCLKRTSLGRPLRRAAGKVQSYKQVPLNIKMTTSTNT